ncbi:MAG: 5'(3')-deoxyribonucleotidase [Bacteroidota bacterium]
MRKRIAIDMDEVIADVLPKFLDLYEATYGRRPAKEEYWGRKLYKVEGGMALRKHLFEKGFFRDLPVIEGSQEAIKLLMEHCDIYITTAAMEFRASFEDKYDWLAEHFPFIHWKNIVFCGDKSVIRTDYMIDDHSFNLKTFAGTGLLFTASHNAHETGYTRVNNWTEVLEFFEGELGVKLVP